MKCNVMLIRNGQSSEQSPLAGLYSRSLTFSSTPKMLILLAHFEPSGCTSAPVSFSQNVKKLY
jgi:hypothetical protein